MANHSWTVCGKKKDHKGNWRCKNGTYPARKKTVFNLHYTKRLGLVTGCWRNGRNSFLLSALRILGDFNVWCSWQPFRVLHTTPQSYGPSKFRCAAAEVSRTWMRKTSVNALRYNITQRVFLSLVGLEYWPSLRRSKVYWTVCRAQHFRRKVRTQLQKLVVRL